MGDFDELEGGFVEVAFERFVAVEVAIGFLDDDVAFEQQAFEDFLDAERRVAGVERAARDVASIVKAARA